MKKVIATLALMSLMQVSFAVEEVNTPLLTKPTSSFVEQLLTMTDADLGIDTGLLGETTGVSPVPDFSAVTVKVEKLQEGSTIDVITIEGGSFLS